MYTRICNITNSSVNLSTQKVSVEKQYIRRTTLLS